MVSNAMFVEITKSYSIKDKDFIKAIIFQRIKLRLFQRFVKILLG